jgi:hypothetical protein
VEAAVLAVDGCSHQCTSQKQQALHKNEGPLVGRVWEQLLRSGCMHKSGNPGPLRLSSCDSTGGKDQGDQCQVQAACSGETKVAWYLVVMRLHSCYGGHSQSRASLHRQATM